MPPVFVLSTATQVKPSDLDLITEQTRSFEAAAALLTNEQVEVAATTGRLTLLIPEVSPMPFVIALADWQQRVLQAEHLARVANAAVPIVDF